MICFPPSLPFSLPQYSYVYDYFEVPVMSGQILRLICGE